MENHHQRDFADRLLCRNFTSLALSPTARTQPQPACTDPAAYHADYLPDRNTLPRLYNHSINTDIHSSTAVWWTGGDEHPCHRFRRARRSLPVWVGRYHPPRARGLCERTRHHLG